MKTSGPSILALFTALAVTGAAHAASVEVRVSNVASAKGQIVVTACDKASFLKTCPISAKAPAATGNIPTEDLAYMLARMGVETGYDLPTLIDAAHWLKSVLGAESLPGMVSRAGGFPAAA